MNYYCKMKDKSRMCIAIIIFVGTSVCFVGALLLTGQHTRDGCLKYHLNIINDTECMANIVGTNMTCELSDRICYSIFFSCHVIFSFK